MDECALLLRQGAVALSVLGFGVYYLGVRRSSETSERGVVSSRMGNIPAEALEVAEIRVQVGDAVDSITFVFRDGVRMWHGQVASTAECFHDDAFVLEPHEYVTEVRSWQGDSTLYALQFCTSTGRCSPVYGDEGGRAFQLSSEGEPIVGLKVTQTNSGRIRCIEGFRTPKELSQTGRAAPGPPAWTTKGFCKYHQEQLFNRLLFIYLGVFSYLLFTLFAASHVFMDVLLGPLDLGNMPSSWFEEGQAGGSLRPCGAPRCYVSVPITEQRGAFSMSSPYLSETYVMTPKVVQWVQVAAVHQDPGAAYNLTLGWSGRIVVYDADVELSSNATAMQTGALPSHVAWIPPPFPALLAPKSVYVGMLRKLSHHLPDDADHMYANGEVYYVDTSFSPTMLLPLLVIMCIMIWKSAIQVLRLLLGWDPVTAALSIYAEPEDVKALMETIDAEIALDSTQVVVCGNTSQVAMGNTWLLSSRWLQFGAASITDVTLVSGRISINYMGMEPVQMALLHMRNRRHGGRDFEMKMPLEAYWRLEDSFVRRVQAAKAERQKQQVADFATEVAAMLLQRQKEGITYKTFVTPDECLGQCGRRANVKISKRCMACQERQECACAVAWCHHCLLKWWIAQNQVKVEMDMAFQSAWQAKCPTCRVPFCLDDLLPFEDTEFVQSSSSSTVPHPAHRDTRRKPTLGRTILEWIIPELRRG